MKKRLSAILILVLAMIMCFALVACDDQNDNDNNYNYDYDYDDRDDPPAPPHYLTDKTQATAFISIDAATSVELTLNCDNEVLSVYGTNDDGKVLLYGEDGMVGESYDIAVSKITALAISLGYLTKDSCNVQTSVTSVIDGDETYLTESVNDHITAIAEGFDIDVKISGPDSYSLTRRYDELQENNPNNSEVRNLTMDEFRVLCSASEATEKPIESMLALDTQALLQTVSVNHRQSEEYATDEYQKEYSLANDIYQKALGEVTDGIYTTYYMVNHPFRAYYGLSYQGYKYTARALKAIANSIDYLISLKDYPLNENQIENIVRILGLENADPITNENGEVTVRSIEAYADMKFKETELSAALEEMKSELTAALKTIESAIQTKIDEIAEEYSAEIETVSNALSSIIDSLNDIKSILPEPVQSAIDDFAGMISSLVGIVSDFRITVAEIRALSDKAYAKADAALAKIQSDLTASELEEIASIQQSAVDGINEAKTKFEEAVKNAADSAKTCLENLKNQRKSA